MQINFNKYGKFLHVYNLIIYEKGSNTIYEPQINVAIGYF